MAAEGRDDRNRTEAVVNQKQLIQHQGNSKGKPGEFGQQRNDMTDRQIV